MTFVAGSDQHRGHRPTMLTPDVKKTILSAVAQGNYVTTACQLAGISKSTYYHWKGRAEENSEEHKEFFEQIAKAEAYAEADRLKHIKTAAENGQWQASAWYLERKYSDRWGRKDRVDQRIEVNGEVIQRNELALEAKLQLDGEGAGLLKQLWNRTNAIDVGK